MLNKTEPANKNNSCALILLDDNLRINNNPLLFNALNNHNEAIIVFILNEQDFRTRGQANKWFLHHCLKEFLYNLEKINLTMFFVNSADYFSTKFSNADLVKSICEEQKISDIYCSLSFDRRSVKYFTELENFCHNSKIRLCQFNLKTLIHPSKIKNKTEGVFKVFTPFWRNCLTAIKDLPELTPSVSSISKIATIPNSAFSSKFLCRDLNVLELIKHRHDWQDNLVKSWQSFSEEEILQKSADFIATKALNYQDNRNFPAIDGTSKLSPFLALGVISPLQILHQIADKFGNDSENYQQNIKVFISEIGWREFAYYLLYHFPESDFRAVNPRFNNFPWQEDQKLYQEHLQKWQKGRTGYPIVDSAMQELWLTGFMHNRTRMIVGSFLVKDLLINWQDGEKWFWDCLVDADLASNVISWQWVAGCGADAAPYFRIFNPHLQSQKFDEEARYIKKFLPQLAHLDNATIHNLGEDANAGLFSNKIPKDYFPPIVNHNQARQKALSALKKLSQ